MPPFGLVLRGVAVNELWLNRHESFPVSTMWQWCVRRSSSAVVIFASAKTLPHSPKERLVVITRLVRS